STHKHFFLFPASPPSVPGHFVGGTPHAQAPPLRVRSGGGPPVGRFDVLIRRVSSGAKRTKTAVGRRAGPARGAGIRYAGRAGRARRAGRVRGRIDAAGVAGRNGGRGQPARSGPLTAQGSGAPGERSARHPNVS